MDLATRPASRSAPKILQIVAAAIGNALEWYDFFVFGFLTVVISRLFFPADSRYASLLLTTATFGIGFFMRPIGGILLGIYADRKGRKAGLQLILGLMTAAIAMIAFAPTYAAIGVAAPLIIVLARLLQGFATGGEWGSAAAIPYDAVYDRSATSHAVNLFDMASKYADVLSTDEALSVLGGLKAAA